MISEKAREIDKFGLVWDAWAWDQQVLAKSVFGLALFTQLLEESHVTFLLIGTETWCLQCRTQLDSSWIATGDIENAEFLKGCLSSVFHFTAPEAQRGLCLWHKLEFQLYHMGMMSCNYISYIDNTASTAQNCSSLLLRTALEASIDSYWYHDWGIINLSFQDPRVLNPWCNQFYHSRHLRYRLLIMDSNPVNILVGGIWCVDVPKQIVMCSFCRDAGRCDVAFPFGVGTVWISETRMVWPVARLYCCFRRNRWEYPC